MFCQKCGKEINDDAAVCIHCGCSTGNNDTAQKSNAAFCKSCGKEVNPNAVVCVHCGCSIVEEKKQNMEVESEHSVLLKVVSFLFPLIGIILYFVKSNDPNKGSYLKLAIIGMVISFGITFCSVFTTFFFI